MMLRISLLVVAATVFALSAGMPLGRSGVAEAGKPALVIEAGSLTDSGDCVGVVNWSGLPGGRHMNITVSLTDSQGGNVWGSFRSETVRQDAGQLTIDFGSQTGDAAEMNVTFMDNRFNQLGVTVVKGTCQ
jgi:hypothetical protein